MKNEFEFTEPSDRIHAILLGCFVDRTLTIGEAREKIIEAAPGRTSPQRIDQVLTGPTGVADYHCTIDKAVERIFKEADD